MPRRAQMDSQRWFRTTKCHTRKFPGAEASRRAEASAVISSSGASFLVGNKAQ